MLQGTKGPFRDVALLNAAAALVVAGKAKDLKDGVALAAKSIDSGAAKDRLDKLIAVSNAAIGHDRHPQDRSRPTSARRSPRPSARGRYAELEAARQGAPPVRGFLERARDRASPPANTR